MRSIRPFMSLSPLLVVGWLSLTQATVQAQAVYDYPVDDGFEATVVGTSAEQVYVFEELAPLRTRSLDVFPDRDYPSVFWYTTELPYGVALQDDPAPLAFVISGTGGGHEEGKMILLANALYQAGSHVVTLPSPTFTDFIVAAAEYSRPGRTSDDVDDLYRVMTMIRDEVARRVEITGYQLTGYSMGGFHSAHLAAHDEKVGRFGFDQVLLLNPPVNLLESANRLDRMLKLAVGDQPEDFARFHARFMLGLSKLYVRADDVTLTGDFLYRLYELEDMQADPVMIRAMIGVAFRLSGVNMLFAADVMNDFGYLVPKGTKLGRTSSLTNYFKTAGHITFNEYVEDVFFPLVQQTDPAATMPALIDEAGLRIIEDYLREAPNIGLIHNEDDIILGPGDIEWFADLFGERGKIYPNGGHLGNVYHSEVVGRIIDFFETNGGTGS